MTASALVKFDAACRAVSEARTFYDALKVRDEGEALRAFGKIAKDRTIETQGVELRLRAERRLGEMLAEAQKAGELAHGGEHGGKKGIDGVRATPTKRTPPPKLESQGIDKNLAKRARTLAKISPGEFESKVSKLKEKVSDTTKRVVAKEFYKEKAPPVIDMNGIARRFTAMLEATFDSEKKGGTYLYNISEYADQVTGKDVKRELIKKIDWAMSMLQRMKEKLEPNLSDRSTGVIDNVVCLDEVRQ